MYYRSYICTSCTVLSCTLKNGGWTPLHWAAVDGYTEVVKVLVEKGANLNQTQVRHHRTSTMTAATAAENCPAHIFHSSL